jgi:ABC-2 type transport system permease protein
MVLGKVLGTSTLAWVQGLMFLAFAPIAGIALTAGGVLQAAAVIFAMAFLFTAFGFTLAWKMESTQGFHAVVNLILFPLWMVSGAVFAPATAAAWIRGLMWVNPVTYPTTALDRVLVPGAAEGLPGLGVSVWVTALSCGLLLAAAVLAANRRSRKGVG